MPLTVDGEKVVLRDQAPLLAREDLASLFGEGLDIASWVQLLNRRVYFFTDATTMGKALAKYVERDGAQEVLALSPLRLLRAAGSRLELTAQNSGAVARRAGSQKTLETFLSVTRFPDKKPAEVTVVDGLVEIDAVVRVERHEPDGTRVALPRA